MSNLTTSVDPSSNSFGYNYNSGNKDAEFTKELSISNYSPISTLARQYQPNSDPSDFSRGRGLLVIVRCNPVCCVTVDQVWKASNSKNATRVDMWASPPSPSSNLDDSPQEQLQQNEENPFSFLNSSTKNESTEILPPSSKTNKTNKMGLNFLKKMASSGSQAIERGIHQLAVRADQGKNPDRLVLGLYSSDSKLIHATESQPITEDDTAHGMQFRIPLLIPTTIKGSVIIKLWVRSGATLAASKHYLVGECSPMDVAQCYVALQQQEPQSALPLLRFAMPLQNSPAVLTGQLHCTVLFDTKFPSLCGKGWSLQDPNSSTSYASGLFHLPLHQSYAFPLRNNISQFVLATERTVESSVVLPLATAWTQLATAACQISMHHAESVQKRLNYHLHGSSEGEHVDVTVRLSHLQTRNAAVLLSGNRRGEMLSSLPTILVNWQRPDSIFEVELLPISPLPFEAIHTNNLSFRFFPKPIRQNDLILPALLQNLPGNQVAPGSFLLGALHMEIALPKGAAVESSSSGDTPVNPFDAVIADETWECIVPLERALNSGGAPGEYPVWNRRGQTMGSVVLTLSATFVQAQQPISTQSLTTAAGGLVDLVGLSPLTDGIYPSLDFDESVTSCVSPEQQRRRSQFATMGNFMTHEYIQQHISHVRQPDFKAMQERSTEYLHALLNSKAPPQHEPSHQDRTPRPFRPSSSRSTAVLSGIGFNVHTASFALDLLSDAPLSTIPPGPVFHNITCGAPADHARGFANVYPGSSGKDKANGQSLQKVVLNSTIGPVVGGLRRLDGARRLLGEQIASHQVALAMSIQNYFVSKRQHGSGTRPIAHISAQNTELGQLRWNVFEAFQCLHHLTWICAIRRSSVFSQTLGTAVSCYLSSISDPQVLQSTWPETWTRHGYLVSYEGLLSAAGKELGMIEDASVAINMLQSVRITLVPDDGSIASDSSRVSVPHSVYLRWIRIRATKSTPSSGTINPTYPNTDYDVQIGIVPSYYDQRIPQALKNGAAVRLVPLLFEVGVDIFQAASNAGSNMSKNMSNTKNSTTGSCDPTFDTTVKETADVPNDNLTTTEEDDDDDTGDIADDDVLVQLNYEAFQKMNLYAQTVAPAALVQATPNTPDTTHPLLASLFQHILTSSGKMNHSILDEAAQLAQQLGGGGVVFCKSGKDRTAMHVTYKQAQFETRFRSKCDASNNNLVDNETDQEKTMLQDAMLIRLHGTRLPVCEKNVGQAKYAFNSLQVKFMPDALKPPMSALAGFLKGGKVFGKSGIES